MKLLEDDFLGGMGSRGYGKICFSSLKIYWNRAKDYKEGKLYKTKVFPLEDLKDQSVQAIIQNFEKIKENIKVD